MTFQNLSYLFQEQSASSHLPKRAVTPEDELVHQDETHNNLNPFGCDFCLGGLKIIDGKAYPPTQPPAKYQVNYQLLFLANDVIKAMWDHKFSWPFQTPVDTIRLRIPDYFKVIRKPMDLGKHLISLTD